MTTSDATFPTRLTKVDDLIRPDHSWLDESDDCFFLGEYTARKGYAYSVTNNLILNLKKDLTKRYTPQWRYKERAIAEVAVALGKALSADFIRQATFVPCPPSKAKSDPLYDDRILRVLQTMAPAQSVDIREIVVQPASRDAIHTSAERPRPLDLVGQYVVDHTKLIPTPTVFAVVDDMLTTGCTFKAVKMMLQKVMPNVKVYGLFVARRVPETDDPF